ncbi:uncharacterized protein H6S33_001647 [Morchella sextelata]|uniref:uncharacterized protein n=1 Tax=Morchella sextelata TaxID=1174677 RepID=UPI001D0452A2|nr:uncharacterized protein H6S33_001647 [Morchella sextelata]KAH0608513.1 hypothetical protein H6S33_001647 [Morchella sextelata]
MALEVLFNAFGHRVVDFNKVDLQTLDNSEALVLDTPTFHERMQSSLPSTISAWDTSKEQKKVVSGLRKVYAASYAEALQIIEHGQANRTVSTTHTNNPSSRSHAFLQIEIKRFSSRNTERGSANLCIVDLAGSERSRTAEAGSINRSLMCLGQCLQLQNEGSDNGKPSIVPWRQSKLTELLFSNSFSGAGGGQGACMIVTADAMGDFSATSQILRYSALAREVSAPRISRSLSICSSVSSCSESAVDALAGSISSLAIATDLTIPPLSAAPEEPSKDTIIARLLSKLHETESRLQLAEERCEALENKCLFIEQSVREEVADDMELRLEEVRRSMLDRLRVEEEWREGYVDGKIEIMKRGIQVHEDAPRSVYLRIEELEDENERLRRELMQLKREAGNRSPSKGQIPREVREAGYRTPSKGQVVKGRKGSKPLKDVLNLEAFRALTISGER